MINNERSRTKKAVLFDNDGTLVDSYDFVFEAVKFALITNGHPYPAKETLNIAKGLPLLEFYETLVPEGDPLMLAESHKKFQDGNFHLVKLFPKIASTLTALKDRGFTLMVVSNRLRESLLKSLNQVGISEYFDVILGADDVKNPKPHKDHLLTALNKLKIKPENAYMVGDTDHDILAGKNAGVKTVGVTYGWSGQDIKKYNPDFVIDEIEELLKIV